MDTDPYIETQNAGEPKIPHYYGDTVRKLFIVAVLAIVVSLPFFISYVSPYTQITMIAIAVLAILAGLTSPRSVPVMFFNQIAAVVGFLVFEYMAATIYNIEGFSMFFIANQSIAICFLLAIYFATKSLRGMRQNGTGDK